MIGYYVHHHGRGHLARATSICAHLRSPVTILSSIPMDGISAHDWVRLPRDDEGPPAVDPTANGALHWAPLHDKGLRIRMQLIAQWVTDARPDLVVVDVSVEVAMLIRLLGVPVVVMAMPGDRTDGPHELVYRIADHILAAWPKSLYEPEWLRQHASKTTYVGGISRFDGRSCAPAPSGSRLNVLALNGSGGSDLDMDVISRCAAMHPKLHWTPLGVPGGRWADDPWPELCAADVVISSAGQSSIADIAAAAKPAIIIAASRPFAEQHDTARALERGGLGVVRYDWPEPGDWPDLIDQARAHRPDEWQRWEVRGAAARAATAIERVATDRVTAVAR